MIGPRLRGEPRPRTDPSRRDRVRQVLYGAVERKRTEGYSDAVLLDLLIEILATHLTDAVLSPETLIP